MMLKDRLQKKTQTIELTQTIEPVTEETTDIAVVDESESNIAVVDDNKAIVPADDSDVNPFGGDTDDASAVDAIRDTIDPDPEKLPFIANSKNPRAGAVGDIVTDYITSIAGNKNASLSDLAKFGKDIVRHCLKHQIGAAGKDNRAKLYLRTLEGRQQMEQEAELMSKESMFGKRR